MKALLKISLLLNFALLSGLLFVLAAGRTKHPSPTPLVQLDNTPSAAAAAVPPTTVPVRGEGRPFNWSQVESGDYRTYIANLRSIGCPEQTIRDIITADVDSQYALRREPLEQKGTGNALAQHTALERGLQDMRKEETSLITGLLGAPTTAAKTSPGAAVDPSSGSVPREPADTTSMPLVSQSAAPSASALNMETSAVALGATSSGSVRKAVPATTSLPLVLQAVDPSVLKLNAQQAQVVNDLGQKFIEEVGGPNQDPNDPAYGQRWQTSQPQADLDLRGMIGIRAWEAYQTAAWANAQDQTSSGP
jgi:hypothetical protein